MHRVWSYDFVEDRTHDGRKYRMLNIVDEFTHECLAMRVARKLKAVDVIDVLSDLFILRGVPGHIRSDNGPEFVAKAVQEWIAAVGAKTAYITPGSPWENGYVESFNARLRDELLDGEIFYTLREAQILQFDRMILWSGGRWPHPIRHWARVCGRDRAGVNHSGRRQDRLHHTRQPLGEWLRRELQCTPAR